jgi:hypothetical protein
MENPRDKIEAEREGYDDSQRAEVHEFEGGGPTDGVILTDMTRDRGEDIDGEDEFADLDDFAADTPDPDGDREAE